jgi:2-polyprenyl-6-methoxyphenol hydroxylase-like FAD-dependent oxidoreductase
MRVGIIGGSIAGCATAALLHRAGHDVIVFERSESDLVSRGAGIVTATAAWRDMMAQGLFGGTVPACRAEFSRFVTRAPGTGQQRWLGDVQGSFTLLNWAHLYQGLRRGVPDDLYRNDAAVGRIEATPHGTTLRLLSGDSVDFDLVVCADGYRSVGRGLLDPGAVPVYRGMVLWRGLLPESDIRADALDGCDLLRPVYQGGHGVVYYIPGPGQGAERGKRLLMWGYYLQVPESALTSVLVDDQERRQSGSVPFGRVHPEVRALSGTWR